MQSHRNAYDRRQNRGFESGSSDDLDLNQRAEGRRVSERLQLRLWTEGRADGKLDFHNCSNLSEAGIFIETPEPYALNSLVEIEFNLPGVHAPVRVTGRVVSVLDEDTAGASIMGNGFRFERISGGDRALVGAFVEASQIAS